MVPNSVSNHIFLSHNTTLYVAFRLINLVFLTALNKHATGYLFVVHQNYVGVDSEKHPFFLSVVLNEDTNQCVPLYRVILFKKTGAQKISLPYAQNKVLTVKQILSNFPNMDKVDKGPKEIFSPDIQKDLLLLEEQEGSVNFKFGIIYMKHGQTTDDEILSNGEHEQF